ncbi:CpsD/CapB family tyrosine-protein kinase [Metallumcola ferriviriculae]|uniref:non-specific protein-tyrosine kinase n=1 Tax=Metallumcola ferriviriculae TaxID=3039180 RepID=A0AAU0UR38_9FIRM|nr:CpsD/CapB family tyrosine-protein kinase [Desulfitibacteraceae bacterium MK1]
MFSSQQKSKKERWLVTYKQPKTAASEAYRLIRTNLKYSQASGQLQSIMFTSAGPGEGKSTTAANVAVTMAQAGQKTLVIDCDMRKPVQHKIFGLTNIMGVTNLLVEHLLPEEVIQETGIYGLNVITCGPIPPNPSELLGSEGMKDFLQNIRGTYDQIIIDCPPVIAVTDAMVAGALVDGVVLVVKAYDSNVDMVNEAKKLLNSAGAKVIGAVLNKVKAKGKDYYYYHYYDS